MFLFVLFFGLNSCSNDNEVKSETKSELNQRTSGNRLGCPDGYNITWVVDYDGVNFRTRKSNCLTNFGLFCLKNREVYWACVDGQGNQVPMIELDNSLQQQRTKVVGIIRHNEPIMEIRFPRQLRDFSPNGDLDFMNLDVEEDYPLDDNNDFFIVKGIYPVTISGNEYVVTVNLR